MSDPINITAAQRIDIPEIKRNDLESGMSEDATAATWSQLLRGEFVGLDGIPIRYGYLAQPVPDRAVVICNGRVETFLKYRELACELFAQGYSVYFLDHRGQGLSGRLLDNSHKGHVEKFEHYLADFDTFIDLVLKPRHYGDHYLLAHSMGAAIASRYLQCYDHPFAAAVLSAPMHGILLPAPEPVIRLVAGALERLTRGLGLEPGYVLGGNDYHHVPFADNELTHSAKRYRAFRQLYQEQPALQLGGPTNRWLLEALDAARACVRDAGKIDIPVQILQAGSDTIVDNQAQLAFFQGLNALAEMEVIHGAMHELLMENDEHRQPAVEKLLAFFAKH